MADVILIYENYLNFILSKPQRYIHEIIAEAENTMLKPHARKGANFCAGLCYYYGLQTKQDIDKAKKCLEFAAVLSQDETKDLTNFCRALKVWIKSHADLVVVDEGPSGHVYFLTEEPQKRYPIGFLLDTFKSHLYYHVSNETKYPFISTYTRLRNIQSRLQVSLAALACISLSHGSMDEKVGACSVLKAVSIYSHNINESELIIGELNLYNARTITVKHAELYFQSIAVPEDYLDNDIKIRLRKLPTEDVEAFIRCDPACNALDGYRNLLKPTVGARFNGKLAAAIFDYSRVFKNPSDEAIHWIEKAAEHGEMQATFIKGIFHQINLDTPAAVRCYLESTQTNSKFPDVPGFAEGFRSLALCYQSGIGVSCDTQKAFDMMVLYCITSRIGHIKGVAKLTTALNGESAGLKHIYAKYHLKVIGDKSCTLKDILDQTAGTSADWSMLVDNLRALANFLMALEYFETYDGLSAHQPFSIKITPGNGQRPLEAALQYLVAAEKFNADAKAFLHEQLYPKQSSRATALKKVVQTQL